MTIILRLQYARKARSLDETDTVQYEEDKYFSDLKAAKEWLNEELPHKRANMYQDTKGGESKHVGYVYSRWNNWTDVKRFLEVIWVSFYERLAISPA